MRQLLTPRWIAGHLFVLLGIAAMTGLTVWQVQRAGAGNPRSYAYAVEWPVFAGFLVYMWWKQVQEVLHPQAASRQSDEPAWGSGKTRTDLAGLANGPVGHVDADDPEVVAYNAYLAGLYAADEEH